MTFSTSEYDTTSYRSLDDLDGDQHAYHLQLLKEDRIGELVLKFVQRLRSKVRKRKEEIETIGCLIGACCIHSFFYRRRFHKLLKCTHVCTCNQIDFDEYMSILYRLD